MHRSAVETHEFQPAQDLIANIANRVMDLAKSPNFFAPLYPAVQENVAYRCFGREVQLDNLVRRSHLARLELQESIGRYLAGKIAERSIKHRATEFERADFRLPENKPFNWRLKLPFLEA